MVKPRFKVSLGTRIALAFVYFIQRRCPVCLEKALIKIPLLKGLFYRARDLVYCHRHNVFYFPIPKVACSTFSSMLVIQDHPASSKKIAQAGIHSFRQAATKRHLNKIPSIFGRSASFTVIRDPYTRLVSAYVDKLVKPIIAEKSWADYERIGKYSFEDLVAQISKLPDSALDKHFRSQYLFFINLKLNHIGEFESLPVTFSYLDNFFPTKDYVKSVPEPKRTQYQNNWLHYCGNLTAQDLAKHKILPKADCFYNEKTRKLVQQRFKQDFALLKSVSSD